MQKLALLLLLVLPNVCLAQREYGFDNSKPSGQPYLDPEETVRRMKVPDGFTVKLFAAEPLLTNPIAFTVDEKGRLWVIECFEYPSRTPPGKMPRDRIVILEDTDGDGRADKRTIFAEGKDFPKRFDLASGIEVGYGGCFVGAAPYLWHLKDTNGDGKADQFDILLEGFGSQDTHETLNTFTWGPDGWLYGLHGVFTSSKVGEPRASALGLPAGASRNPAADAAGSPVEIDAGVWRYHPKRKKFEVFAEGTSNPWGMDFDSNGNCFACCCVIPHLFHIVPGGIYRRQAGASKHPYAFGELREICDHTFHKESGWAHAGLLCLDTQAMPAEFRTSVIFGSIHGNSLKRNVLRPNGSSFIASKAPDFLSCGDKNFRPVGLRWGPGGSIYVSDWHDQNPCHQAKPESWDYARGRIYAIVPKNTPRPPTIDLAKLSPEQQVERLGDESPWTSRQVARLLMEDPRRISNDLHPRLKERVIIDHQAACFGVYHAWDEFVRGELPNAKFISEFLSAKEGRSVGYRRAGLRIFGESKLVNFEHLTALAMLAQSEPDPAIRAELAVIALRRSYTPLLRSCLSHREDVGDPVIPLLLWLAYEKQLLGRPIDLKGLAEGLRWPIANASGNSLIIDSILPRLSRRFAHMQDDELGVKYPLAFAVKDSDDIAVRTAVWKGLVEGLRERPPGGTTATLDLSAFLKGAKGEELEHLRTLDLLLNAQKSRPELLRLIGDAKAEVSLRKLAMQQLAGIREPAAVAPLLALVTSETNEDLKLAALEALDEFPNADLARRLLPLYAKASPTLRRALLRFASSRKEWARDLLAAVGDTGIPRTDISDVVILRLRAFNDHALDDLIEKRWGRFRATPAEVEEAIKSWETKLRQQPGVAERGKVVFTNRCAQCHQFAGQGSEVGPALDGADRSLSYLLVNILDPNRVVGAPYHARVILLKNGKLVTGLLIAEDGETLTLKSENAIRQVIRKADIEEQKAADQSLMPADLAKQMKDEEFRDLMEYLRRK